MRATEELASDNRLEDRLHALSGHSVPSLISDLAAKMPHRLALSARSARGFRDRLTFRQVEIRIARLGHSLREMGIGREDRVATFLTNDAGREFILTALGAMARGSIAVPLNTRSSDAELSHALALVAPAVIVTVCSSVERLRRLAAPDARILVVDGSASGASEWPEPEHFTGVAADLHAVGPDDIASLLFTSGTTGHAKAVMSSHRTMIATGLCTGSALGLTADDVYQAGFPVFTSSVLNLALMSCWVAGAALVLEEAVDNHQRLALIASEGTSVYHGVPAVLSFMMRAYDPEIHNLSNLRRVANGGAAMPPSVMEEIRRRLPGVDQIQIYGLTESGPAGTVLDVDRAPFPAGTVGKAMPLCEVHVVDEDGNRLPPGRMGEIEIFGPGVALGYYRNAEATAASFHGRAIRTGDVGQLDAAGYLFFGDRKKDIINRGGLKIASVAVEHALHQHEAVKEAAVVAVPHPDLGEDVGAMIALHPGMQADMDELREFCRSRLADYEVPRRWQFVEALPRNPMGKVLKTEVREMFRGGAKA